MKRFQPLKISACLLALALCACSPKVDARGYVKEVDLKDQIVAGSTTRDEVLGRLGSPSSQSTFGNETWYYISAREETYAFLKPETVTREIVRVEFDEAGVVTKVETFDKESGQDLELVKRTTPTEGHSLTVMEQFLGNIGRFNNSSNNSIAGGRPGH